jgi:hypothetical protein
MLDLPILLSHTSRQDLRALQRHLWWDQGRAPRAGEVEHAAGRKEALYPLLDVAVYVGRRVDKIYAAEQLDGRCQGLASKEVHLHRLHPPPDLNGLDAAQSGHAYKRAVGAQLSSITT